MRKLFLAGVALLILTKIADAETINIQRLGNFVYFDEVDPMDDTVKHIVAMGLGRGGISIKCEKSLPYAMFMPGEYLGKDDFARRRLEYRVDNKSIIEQT